MKSRPDPELDFARWIVWEDEGLIAVDKPAGVLSQGGEGGAGINLVDLARAHLGRGGIGVLHRLDRNVSGVVLIAKDAEAAREMNPLFAAHAVERVYRAVVGGEPPEAPWTMDAWLAKDGATREVRGATAAELAALPETERAAYREARTEARALRRWRAPLGPCAELEVRPITGRSHQIRVHLAGAGLPIVGDPKYGVAAWEVRRPLLHAERIAFVHPRTGAHVEIRAPIPWTEEDLATLSPLPRAGPRGRRPPWSGAPPRAGPGDTSRRPRGRRGR